VYLNARLVGRLRRQAGGATDFQYDAAWLQWESAIPVIIDFEDQRVLAVERFDRLWTRDKRLLRLPQEDCCQALSVPPVRKYESDGGPGIFAISDLLKASDTPDDDRKTFLKAQMVFWLLGATDGHAKNFSLRLAPGGRFRLAPLYDIISTQPSLDAGHIRQNQMKLAMAIGNNRHYVVHTIFGRHFLQTAERCGLPGRMVKETIAELIAIVPAAIAKTVAALPAKFPAKLSSSIADAARRRLRLLESTSR
jgi:serine/threonine-protein kinase HipA